jgi:hypothetical protein
MRDIERDARGARDAVAEERSFLSLVPWRNFRRVAFLILALLGIVALKRSSGGFFSRLLDGVAPPAPSSSRAGPSARAAPAVRAAETAPAAPAIETTVHLRAAPVAR